MSQSPADLVRFLKGAADSFKRASASIIEAVALLEADIAEDVVEDPNRNHAREGMTLILSATLEAGTKSLEVGEMFLPPMLPPSGMVH